MVLGQASFSGRLKPLLCACADMRTAEKGRGRFFRQILDISGTKAHLPQNPVPPAVGKMKPVLESLRLHKCEASVQEAGCYALWPLSLTDCGKPSGYDYISVLSVYVYTYTPIHIIYMYIYAYMLRC